MASLPDKNSPELHLVVATAEEHYAQTHANSEEWRGALSLPAYFRREDHLLNQDLTKNGGLTPWLLVHQPVGTSEKDRKVLCGCETIKKTALAATNGRVQVEIAHGVASVFCPPQFRGKGYAGRMMAELGEKLKGWQVKDQPALFSVLWSDIGKDFYAARGWKAFPSSHISLAASPQSPSSLFQTKPLKAADLPALCDSDSQSLRTELSSAIKPTVALLPDAATLAWHHAREEFIAKELYNSNPETKGALVEIAPGRRAWCVWTRVWTNPADDDANTLHILRLAIEDDTAQDFGPASEEGIVNVQGSPVIDAIAALFAAAQKEAADWEMEAVEFWNPTSVALAAARKIDGHAKVHEREKASICSLRWYGEGDGEDLQWVCNEKYGWC